LSNDIEKYNIFWEKKYEENNNPDLLSHEVEKMTIILFRNLCPKQTAPDK